MDSEKETSLKSRIFIAKDEDEQTHPCLKSTKASPEQAWSAYTYYIAKTPVNNIHGLFKIVCTGPTAKAVDSYVKLLIDRGDLEQDLPFVAIRRTGIYVKLIPGGDPDAEKEKYEPAGKEVKTLAIMERQRQRATKEKELRVRQKMLYDEIENQEDEFSYDRYVILRNRMISYQQNRDVLIQRNKDLDKAEKKVGVQLFAIEKKMGNFKQKYENDRQGLVKEVSKNPSKNPTKNTTTKTVTKIGRNDSCTCGSGKKYKKCCLNKDVKENNTDNDIKEDNNMKEKIDDIKKKLDDIKEKI